jgi:hypothetical protein
VAKSKTLTPFGKTLVNTYEGYVLEHSKAPTFKELSELLSTPVDIITRLLSTELVGSALIRRGIHPPVIKNTPVGITPEMLAAVALVFDFNDFRPLGTKLKQLGITTRQWNGWLRSNKTFGNLVKRRSDEAFSELLPTAHSGLAASLQRGDSSTLRLYYEIMGYSRPATDPQALKLINALVELLVEVVTKNVKDPEERKIIAGELEKLQLG